MTVEIVWIDTKDVQVGDKIACLLSDARAYPRVTGWTDRVLELSKQGLKDFTQRTFQVSGAPWWAEDMTTFDLSGQAPIVSREAKEDQEPENGDGTGMPSIEQMQSWMSEGGAEARDGCWVEPDGTCEHGSPSWLLAIGVI
ncbi:hypothetical protein OG897_39500 [Streptomyces sp. NBC_00237]|uniref:hypothetical protein n=1 Tax=Streptomyces sp. NBC_00237 TaxID=2975687 RepID=UPI00224FB2AA|nr:hypothetical protein [Streptomyces sp. NBC_00237]MCX5207476.1 hypothetical protein [Streptomyces sp. NBC_00237]